MERKDFIKYSTLVTGAMLSGGISTASRFAKPSAKKIEPLAIAMWDFSWLERRWAGAGYEDWDQALDELVERGYNAVRIDAYPHLIGEDSTKEYTLLPVWNVQMWGSPAKTKVRVQPFLNQFIAKCRERNVKVGLSSWYREDVDRVLMNIDGPEKMAENWIKTLDSIAKDGLLDSILYVDLCNEWPGDIWCPYFKNDPPENTWTYWHTEKSIQFMKESIGFVRSAYPELPYCYSFTGGKPELYAERDLSYFDFIEHHLWMAQLNDGEYDKAVDYNYERFSPVGYQNLVANYERVYHERKSYWQQLLTDEIQLVANSAKATNQPLITTECWGLVDFKDWPLLKWDIIKELGELAVKTAANTGQWVAMATSNFCGPQFVGMWRDVEWHQRMTKIIKDASISEELKTRKIISRL
ncbi:cellulase-like family protein [Sunxiuqinia sp. A32]|uniref:cellulase-like family protein n=1 Tax=Sunxiuqinia sp. A32 TaxID=3461496 RepID=UPI004045ED57